MSWQIKNDYDGRTEVIANVDGESFADGTSSYSYDFICNTALDEFGDDTVDRNLAAERARLIAAAPDMLEALQAIMRRGELANISADPFGNYGGKKPPTKDVFAFPRHMLTAIEEALAKAGAA